MERTTRIARRATSGPLLEGDVEEVAVLAEARDLALEHLHVLAEMAARKALKRPHSRITVRPLRRKLRAARGGRAETEARRRIQVDKTQRSALLHDRAEKSRQGDVLDLVDRRLTLRARLRAARVAVGGNGHLHARGGVVGALVNDLRASGSERDGGFPDRRLALHRGLPRRRVR